MTETLPAELAELLSRSVAAVPDEAWERFVASVSPLVLHVCRSFGGGPDAAMDRYSAVLDGLRANDLHRLRQFAPDRKVRFTTWLVVVVRRLCQEHHRQQFGRIRTDRAEEPDPELLLRRRLLLGLSAEVDILELAGSAGRPGEDLERDELAGAIAAALARLEPRDQLLLQLRFEGDYTAQEIARQLDLPTPFHVYRRLRVVLATLRQILRSSGFHDG